MPVHAYPEPWTVADYASLITAALYFIQPGVDRQAVVQWLTDNVFGSTRYFAWWGIFVGHKVCEYAVLGFYSLLYKLEVPLFERHRSFPHKPWPWNDPNPKVRAEYYELRNRAVKYTFKFHAVVFVIQYFLGAATAKGPWKNFAAENTPHWFTSMWQVFVGVFIAETGFYWAHRLLHTPRFYWMHKKHHEFKDCTVWATYYVHPIDALLTDIIPAGLPLILLDMHIYTIYMYTVPILLNAAWVHCGYELPLRFNPLLGLPLATQSEQMHDIHHRMSKFNYGAAYFIWDRVCGTYRRPPSLEVRGDAAAARALLARETLNFEHQMLQPSASSSSDAASPASEAAAAAPVLPSPLDSKQE